MLKGITFITLISFAGLVSANSPTKMWVKIISDCAPTQAIGKNILFFGLSNDVGPGSVWRYASDKSLRIKFELSDAFPATTDQDRLITKGNFNPCANNSATDWDIKLGLPFSINADSISADIGAVLSSATHVKVSLTGVGTDLLKETKWKHAFAALTPPNEYADALLEPDGLLAENAVKVKGMTMVFTYDRALGVDIQAKFKTKSFSVTDAGTAAGTSSSSSRGSADGGQRSGANSSSSSGGLSASEGSSSSGGSSGNAGSSSSGGASTTNSGACPKIPVPDTMAPDASPKSAGGLTLHAGLQSDKEIVLCADGPFYILAAYSKVIDGKPVGIAPGGPKEVLIQQRKDAFPDNTKVFNDRSPTPH